MAVLTGGYAGCGKSFTLKNDVNNLVEKHICPKDDVLILTQTPDLNALYPENIAVWSVEKLCKFILKKACSTINCKIISDYEAIIIIGEICRDIFPQNSNLRALIKSKSFFRELYNLFAALKNSNISSVDFKNKIDETDIQPIDKERLELICCVFKMYQKILAENGFLDYRDIVKKAFDILSSEPITLEIVQKRFGHIFVDNFENITFLQFELIKLLAKKSDLYIYYDNHSRIQQYRGCGGIDVNSDDFKDSFQNIEQKFLNTSKRNIEILERALYLVRKYNNPAYDCDFSENNQIKYFKFTDVNEEIANIVMDIQEKIKNDGAKYSDFAILLRDYSSVEKFVELFRSHNLRVSGEIYVEDFNNFFVILSRYINIFSIFEKFNLKYFSYKNSLTNFKAQSKIDASNLLDELNLYLTNILNELFENKYITEQFLAILEKKKFNSLLEVINENISILNSEDEKKLLQEFDFMSDTYKLFQNRQFTDFLIKIANKNPEYFKNENFNKIFAKFLSQAIKINNLYIDILHKDFDYSELGEIFSKIKLTTENEDSIDISTFFKAYGKEYKYVYIPSLIEDVFPKINQSTYFISQTSNEKISKQLRELNANFKNIIENPKDSLKEEAALMYIGMTRATKNLWLSSYCYKDKKPVETSSFFEMLIYKENIKPDFENEEQDSSDVVSIQKVDSIDIESQLSTVIAEDEILKLNASSISNYQNCPRKFYYSNLLNLKSTNNNNSTYGSTVHAVFELFNQTSLNSYTPQRILYLSEIIFNAKNKSKEAKEGFKDEIIELILNTDDLSIEEMKSNFADAINCLEQIGFFLTVPEKVVTEKSFEFNIPDIRNVIFDGRIDAIYTFNGENQVVDYKTGKNNQYKLDYYLSDNGVSFLTSRGSVPADESKYVSDYKYQIPLYFLGCNNSEALSEYKDTISSLGLKFVRPKSKENGSTEDIVSAEQVNLQKEKIIKNLNDTIISKIRETVTFEQKTDWNCQNCDYNFLCEEGDCDE
ncbi:MAG: ATP-dependent DNA helicase [Candidatus Gastranaerophilales bacterium]|nr:ATP-dependent DNA helicase [Candidatus Gastranaerophilales bacterium]